MLESCTILLEAIQLLTVNGIPCRTTTLILFPSSYILLKLELELYLIVGEGHYLGGLT